MSTGRHREAKEMKAELEAVRSELAQLRLLLARQGEMLAQAEEKLASWGKFPDENPFPVIRLSREGKVVYQNLAGARLLSEMHEDGSSLDLMRDLQARSLQDGAINEADIECGQKVYNLRVVPLVESGFVNIYGMDTTTCTRAFRELEENDERFRALVGSVGVGIIFQEAGGKILSWNKEAEEIFGLSEQEAVGATSVGRDWGVYYPDGTPCPGSEHPSMKTLETGAPCENVELMVKREDETHWININTRPLFRPGEKKPYAAAVSVSDISQRKRMEEQRRESEARYKVLFSGGTDGVLAADADSRRLVLANPAVCEMFGYTEEELCSLKIDDIHPPRDLNRVLGAFQALIDMDSDQALEIPCLRKNGTVFQADIKCAQMELQGRLCAVGFFRDATARLEADRIIRESEERYRRLMENIPDAVLVCVDGVIVYANEASERMFRAEDGKPLVGRLIQNLIPADKHVRSIERLLDLNAPGGERSAPVEIRFARDDQSRFDAEVFSGWTKYRGLSAAQLLVHDITVRKRSLDILKARLYLGQFASRRPLDDLLQASLDEAELLTESEIGFFHFVLPDQKTLSLQNWSTRTMGQCKAVGKGMHYPIAKAGVWVDCVRTGAPVIHNDYESLENKKGLPEGHAPVVRELVSPVFQDGKIVAILGVGNKRTDYQAEDLETVNQLAHLAWDVVARKIATDELVKAKDQAEAANKAKSEFLANMSHEIRTPLNGVMGMLQLMQSEPLSDEHKEYIGVALQSCKRLTSLLSDILDLSRIESGRMRVVEKEFKFDDIIDELKMLFGASAEQAGIDFSIRIDRRIPRKLIGDDLRLRQILFNLLGNALKYAPGETVRLEAFPLPLGGPNVRRILFVVSDTGIGIPDKLIDHIFEEFAQAEYAYARKFQGAGLGLPIVKNLVTLMGGTIAVSSEEGKGASFYVSIPFKLVESESGRDIVSDLAEPVSIIEKRGLLVEDDAINRRALRRILESRGLVVGEAVNGEEALSALKREEFDFILMDVQMPVMDGVEAARRIRNNPEYRDKADIPIIALTAYAMAGDKDKFLEAGLDDYLAKPVEMDDLFRTIARVLEKRKLQ